MTKTPGTTWLLVGSATQGALFADAAHAAALVNGWQTATCNSGWQLFATASGAGGDGWVRPDWFWLSDPEACSMPAHRRALATMRRHGTKLVTVRLHSDYLYEQRGLGEPDAIAPRGESMRHPYVPGRWCQPKFSGLMLLQWVLQTQSPLRVVLVGYDGYGSTEGRVIRETIDGRLGKHDGSADTQDIIQPFIASCIHALRDVQFIFCGRPKYDLPEADNAVVLREPSLLEDLV